jgi:hypothetical protein
MSIEIEDCGQCHDQRSTGIVYNLIGVSLLVLDVQVVLAQKSLLDCSRSKPEAHQFMSRFVYKGGDRMEVNSEQYRSLRKLGWNSKDM